METVVNIYVQLVFPSAVFPHLLVPALIPLISDGVMPEQCIGIAHDKKCITIYIIKLPYKTCMNFI